MLRLMFLWYIDGIKKATNILRIDCLKIWQWMKRAIQWFPQVKRDIFKRYAAKKLLKLSIIATGMDFVLNFIMSSDGVNFYW